MILGRIILGSMRKINKIIVHVSDTPDDMHYDIDHIRHWHVKENGWSDVGYHFVITRIGEVQIGRNIIRPGAHTQGHNHDSIGVCWVGRHKTSPRQYRAMKEFIAELLYKFKLDTTAIAGHNEFNENKTCPNISIETLRTDVEPWLKNLQSSTTKK